jgi:hypothetical protein
MKEFQFEANFNFNINKNKADLYFKNRGEKSEKVIDFTNTAQCNELMKFEIINSMNFKIPEIGENLFMITTKPISLMDVVNYIEKKIGQISDITIFFFTVNKLAAEYTVSLASRANIQVIISDIVNSSREKERLITKIFDKANVEIVFCHNHAKIASFKIGDNFFTLIGSMNAGTNAKIENLNIINSKEMYSFVLKTFDIMKNKFSIKKRYL